MKIKWKVPVSFYVNGSSPDIQNTTFGFYQDDVVISVQLKGNDILSSDEFPTESRYFLKATKVSFLIDEIANITTEESDYPKLLSFLVKITNRVLHEFRLLKNVIDNK